LKAALVKSAVPLNAASLNDALMWKVACSKSASPTNVDLMNRAAEKTP